jgi:hypothetical protein
LSQDRLGIEQWLLERTLIYIIDVGGCAGLQNPLAEYLKHRFALIVYQFSQGFESEIEG